jgi:hypothetical protein
MQERHEYPTAVPCWVDVESPDPAGAAAFYAGLFGWTFEERAGYRVGRLRGGEVAGIGPASPDPGWHMYVRVSDVAEAAAKVTAAGGAVVREPYEVPGVARVAVCADPAGARFRAWEPAGIEGARLVNESGTWNFNELNTRDFDGAKDFYGTVFGWEASALEFEGGSFTMWRRPGYADFLETIDPGVRRRHQEAGAPPGFTDAVGWMQEPAGEDQPAHWSVTFAVDDADATAQRAERLGGTVVVPPFDAGPSRIAVLRDPQGAVFTANRYNG